MTEPIAGSLVWVAGLKAPCAEKWSADTTAGAKANKTILAEHKLFPDEFQLSIPILEQRYPAPPWTGLKTPPTGAIK